MRAWARRTAELQRELAAIAEIDRRWWLLAGGVALAETRATPEIYLACDAEPDADTFMGYRATAPARSGGRRDPPREGRAHRAARARRQSSRISRSRSRSIIRAAPRRAPASSTSRRSRSATGASPRRWTIRRSRRSSPPCSAVRSRRPGAARRRSCACRIGDEPIETARHGHRRAWTERGGPWLGLGRAGDLAVVSTCHLIIDGYGHASIAARIAGLVDGAAARSAAPANGHAALPPLGAVAGAVPLAVTWRELPQPTPRVIPLAYELGRILHRHAGRRDARFSPTIQIPVARGRMDDPMRLRRRIVSATTSVRFTDGVPEPFAAFEARVRDVFAREAAANGLVSRLLAAARALPVPVSWKRRSISAKRPHWFESVAAVIGGRALLSRIAMDYADPGAVRGVIAVAPRHRRRSDRRVRDHDRRRRQPRRDHRRRIRLRRHGRHGVGVPRRAARHHRRRHRHREVNGLVMIGTRDPEAGIARRDQSVFLGRGFGPGSGFASALLGRGCRAPAPARPPAAARSASNSARASRSASSRLFTAVAGAGRSAGSAPRLASASSSRMCSRAAASARST